MMENSAATAIAATENLLAKVNPHMNDVDFAKHCSRYIYTRNAAEVVWAHTDYAEW
jgi:hypothetical protein